MTLLFILNKYCAQLHVYSIIAPLKLFFFLYSLILPHKLYAATYIETFITVVPLLYFVLFKSGPVLTLLQ
jgi:hypothetical protein